VTTLVKVVPLSILYIEFTTCTNCLSQRCIRYFFQFFVLDSNLDLLRGFLNIGFVFKLAWRGL
jgi:hypothetical protein